MIIKRNVTGWKAVCSIAADIRQTVHSFAKQRSALHCRTLQILQSCYTLRLGCRSAGLLCRNALASQFEEMGDLFFQGCILYSFTSHNYRSCSISLMKNFSAYFYPQCMSGHRLVERGWLTSGQTSWKAREEDQLLRNRGSISNLARHLRTEEALARRSEGRRRWRAGVVSFFLLLLIN